MRSQNVRFERRHHRCVVARPDLAVGRARHGPRRKRFTGQHIVEPPSDVALPKIAPWSPPGEVVLVVRVELATDVDYPLEERDLLEAMIAGAVADDARLPLLRGLAEA